MIPVRRVLSEKRAFVVPLALGVLVNVLIYALIVYPLQVQVDGAEARARAASDALRAAVQEHAAAEATVSGKKRADEDLARFYGEVLPADLAGARRITYLRLAQLAERANLRPGRRATDEPRQPQDSLVRKLRMTVMLAGEYRDIRRFIHEVETAPEFLVIEDIGLAQAEDRASPLMLTLEVSTYYRAEEHGR